MVWVPYGEKKFEGISIRFDRKHERDGHIHTHRDIQTPHDGIGRAYAQHRAAKIGQYYLPKLCSTKKVSSFFDSQCITDFRWFMLKLNV